MAVNLNVTTSLYSPTLRMAPTAQVLPRGRCDIQFGLDATRCGIFTVPAPAKPARVRAVLTRMRTPTPRTKLHDDLTSAGLTAHVASALIDDLTSFNILTPARSITVAVLGRTPLAHAVADLLSSYGLDAVLPGPTDSDTAFIVAAHRMGWLMVVTDKLGCSLRLAPHLARWHDTWVPVQVIDSQGLVGPVRIDGAGACPMCFDLHRSRIDPQWYTVAGGLGTDGSRRQDPIAVAATAAAAARVILELVGMPSPPGLSPLGLRSGDVAVAKPYEAVASQRIRLAQHPECPVCFFS